MIGEQAFDRYVIPIVFSRDCIVRHVPDWMPGTGFKKTAKRWKRTLTELAEKPHAFVKKQMAAGIAPPSYTSLLLEKGDLLLPRRGKCY